MQQIPVYAFTGFLDSGKTKFIQETLEDPRFNAGERTLLLNELQVGRKLNIADSRFISKNYETLSIQSITYSWDESTTMLPNVEVTLSDYIPSIVNPVDDVALQVEALKQDVSRKFISTTNEVSTLKRVAKASNTKVSETKEVAIEAQTQAKKASETATAGIESNKEALFAVQKQVDTLIGSDRGKSVRDIALGLIPTAIATAMQKRELTPETTHISPNIFYEGAIGFTEFTLPELTGDSEMYQNIWKMRLTLTNSNKLTYPYAIRWVNNLVPQFDTVSILDLTFTKDFGGKIYGEWTLFKS